MKPRLFLVAAVLGLLWLAVRATVDRLFLPPFLCEGELG